MKQSYEYLFAGTILGFSVSLLFISCFTLNLETIKIVAYVVPIGAFLFAIHKYVEELEYKKKKDAYEFYEKYIYEKFLDLTDKINERFKYREHFLSLSTDEVLQHKKDLTKIVFILENLYSKIANDFLDMKILSLYFGKTMFFNLLVHFDMTLQSHPKVVYDLYKLFYDDFDEFEKNAKEQHKEQYIFLDENKHLIKVTIDDVTKSIDEWLQFTAKNIDKCIEKDQILRILQSIKYIYPFSAIYSNIGNVYSTCFNDHNIALKVFQKAYSLDNSNIYAYAGAMVTNYRINKNIEIAFSELNTIELSKQDDDFILRNKIGLYIEERKKVEARELIKKIKDPILKDFSIRQVESC